MNNPNQCVIHCRVSSAKQAQEGESLDVQQRVCRELIARNGWTLSHEPWLEAFSGRKNNRPVFAEILKFLDQHPGKVRFYVFRSIDRFTRGGSYTYEAMKRELAVRGVAMVDSYGVIQAPTNTLADVGFEYDWSRFSPSEITETVLANTAKAEINTILTRMIGQEIRLTQQGYKVRAPQDGYQNKRLHAGGRKRTIQVPDEARAKFYITMFELRAAGNLTDTEIVGRINAMGFRTKAHHRWDADHQQIIGSGGGVLLTVKKLQEIIKRPIYCGVVWEKWTNWHPIKAAYPGLVSIEIYNAANRGVRFIHQVGDALEMRYNYDPDRPKPSTSNPLFPFKNVVACPQCRKPFMASSSRSRSGKPMPAYHCTRNHPRVGVNKATFEKAVHRYINQLKFRPEIIAVVEEEILSSYREWQGSLLHVAADVGRAVADLETQKADIVAAFKATQSNTMRRELERDIERLETQIEQGKNERNDLEVKEQDVANYIAEVISVMEHPGKLLIEPMNTPERVRLFALAFEEMPTLSEMVSGTAKLTSVFAVFEGVEDTKSLLVRLQGLDWNRIEKDIHRWSKLRSFSYQ